MDQNLEYELVNMVINQCNVEGISAKDVNLSVPIIGPESPLDLDSLDALEIVVAVQKNYNVRIGGENTSREILESFNALARFIRQNKQMVA